LLAEYAIVTRQFDLSPEKILYWREVAENTFRPGKYRFFLDAASFMLAAKRTASLRSILDQLVETGEARERLNLRDNAVDFLQGMAAVLAKPESAAAFASRARAGHVNEWELRALVSLLLTCDRLAPETARELADFGGKNGLGFGPIGGSVLYDLTLARVGLALAAGDLAGAVAIVRKTLNLPFSALFPYYPRLLFLRAGLYNLAGGRGHLAALAEQVKASPMASRLEQTLARYMLHESDSARSRLRARSQCRFWFAWLLGTKRLYEQGGSERDNVMVWFAKEKNNAAEQHLLDGLDSFAALNPGRGGAPDKDR
jgi:hypothetical protein